MHEKLEKYLEEIGHYLAVNKEKEEILIEIKSHVLEKTEQEFGEITEETLERVIETYGPPRKVAEKYMEGTQIIASSFKGYLIRYTAILFAFHLALILLSFILKTSMLIFPFFYIPKIDGFQTLSYLPMAFIYDLGLVGLLLYFVTQSRKDVRLPWPKLKLNWEKMSENRQAKSRIIPFILMLSGYTALFWLYLRYGALFFKTIDFQKTQPLLTPVASKWYSAAILALLGVGLAAYFLKFFIRSEWVNLVRCACQFVILGIAINRPIENPFMEFVYIDLQITANIFIAIVSISIAIDFLKSLIILGRKAFMKKPL
jgi:hypothetical protein